MTLVPYLSAPKESVPILNNKQTQGLRVRPSGRTVDAR